MAASIDGSRAPAEALTAMGAVPARCFQTGREHLYDAQAALRSGLVHAAAS